MTEINKRILTSVALLLMLTVSFFNKYILTLVCIFIIYQILFEFNYMLKKIFIFKKKKMDEKKLIRVLKEEKINLICLAGFMKILSRDFIKNFKGKILNIHPSLLPNYKGLNTHTRVLINKEKYTGCTVHFVSPKLDDGKIIIQKKIKIKKNDTPKKLAKRVLIEEHKLYPKAILKIFNL